MNPKQLVDIQDSKCIWHLDKILEHVVSRLHGVEAIYLFGSRAHRSGSLRSDIDLLVYSKEQLDLATALTLQDDIPPLDIFRSRDMRFAESVVNGSTIRARFPMSLKTTLSAILLWDRRDGLSKAFQYWDQETRIDIKFVKTVAYLPRSFATKVFIGHGRSKEWIKLRDYLSGDLHLKCDEFNAEPVAGFSVATRLETMLNDALFALLVATPEDEAADGSWRMRENVAHEIGLFQGRLGFRKAIVLLEEGCGDFSNISGIVQIRFPAARIDHVFDEVKAVLARESVTRPHRGTDSPDG